MFSMCSELNPRATIPDGRIAQIMQPCRVTAGSLIHLLMEVRRGPCLQNIRHFEILMIKSFHHILGIRSQIRQLPLQQPIGLQFCDNQEEVSNTWETGVVLPGTTIFTLAGLQPNTSYLLRFCDISLLWWTKCHCGWYQVETCHRFEVF